MALFTKEELAAMAAADEEIDREFRLTNEELRASRARDRAAVLDAMDPKMRKRAAAKRAYYEANLLMRIAYAREYRRKRRSANAVTGGGTQ